MTTAQWVGIVVAVVAVPGVGFWLTLRQDSVRWYREKRADSYIDLLIEADAERQYMHYEFTRQQMAEIDAQYSGDASDPASAVAEFDRDTAGRPDTRLPPYERAQLGARGTAYGSTEVIRRFNALQRIGFFGTTINRRHPHMKKYEADKAFDLLESQIKKELRRYGPWRERRRERSE